MHVMVEGLELTYSVPESLSGRVLPGCLVLVPLRNRTAKGVVVGIGDEEAGIELKEMVSLVYDTPVIDEEGIEATIVADSLAFSKAGTTLSDNLWMPPSPRIETKVEILGECEFSPSEKTLFEKIVQLGDDATLGRLNHALGKSRVTYALRGLVKKGAIRLVEVVSAPLLPKPKLQYEADPDVDSSVNEKAPFCSSMSSLSKASGVSLSKIKKLVLSGKLRLVESAKPGSVPKQEKPGFDVEFFEGLVLEKRVALYADWARGHMASGQNMAIIAPDASLCRAIHKEISKIVDDGVYLATGDGSMANDSRLWDALRSSLPCVAIGMGQALFLPFANLSRVVVDEPASPHYEQDQPGKLRLGALARVRAKVGKCNLSLVGAPSTLEALKEGATPVSLPNRVEVVNMLFQAGAKNQPLVSEGMVSAIKKELEAGRPSVVLIARKGYSNFVYCDECNEVVSCPTCKVPLMYSLATGKVSCRFCGYEAKAPSTCPSCGGVSVLFKAGGTERLHLELEERLPQCRILRADASTKNAFANIRSFGQPGDVLVGTTMILDRTDFSNVRLACIASLDGVMSMPVFSASHKAYSLVAILAGKLSSGRVLLQTYMPHHPLIKSLVASDAGTFLMQELEDRKESFYPPFSQVLWWIVTSKEQGEAERWAKFCYETLQELVKDATILPPNATYYHRLKGEYRWDILLKIKDLEGAVPSLWEAMKLCRMKGIKLEVVNPNQ